MSRVMVRVRSFALLLLVLATPAAADDRRVAPNAPLALEPAIAGYGIGEGNISISALGASAELAVGHGRWQYLASGFVGYGMALRGRTSNDGFALRPAVGARYIARSFSFGTGGALELGLEGSIGYDMIWWRGGSITRRPDVQLGVDWQARLFESRLHVVRLAIDMVVAPADDPQQMFVCRGSCGPTASRSALSRGLFAAMGFGW